jgi:hypothetical protein
MKISLTVFCLCLTLAASACDESMNKTSALESSIENSSEQEIAENEQIASREQISAADFGPVGAQR